MTSMTHRERVLAALNHQETDRVPIDFGGTMCTTISLDAYEHLKSFLGLEHETKVFHVTNMMALPHRSVLERFDVDTRNLSFGPPQIKINDDLYSDEWGVSWGRDPGHFHFMPVDGPFYDKATTLADVENWGWPDVDDPAYYGNLEARATALRRAIDCAICLQFGSGPVHMGQWQRGFSQWLKDLYKNRELAERMADIYADLWIKIAGHALDAVGDNVDVIALGDDLSSQAGPIFSPEIYRAVIKPRHARMFAAVKARTDAKLLYHSCGGIFDYVEDLVEIGVDAINPVQVNAAGMEPARLKKTFGDRLAFWGGVDTQHVLPYGTVDEVRAETRRMIDILGKGGGYVLNSVHTIQPEVPAANVAAMFDAGRMHS